MKVWQNSECMEKTSKALYIVFFSTRGVNDKFEAIYDFADCFSFLFCGMMLFFAEKKTFLYNEHRFNACKNLMLCLYFDCILYLDPTSEEPNLL